MTKIVTISICIPAYKQTAYLTRLLESISVQHFRDFEVVLTDDSPDGSVQEVVERFAGVLPVRYIKNPQAQGTPENWNAAIRHATGRWIKIMHHDDWFTGPGVLDRYAAEIAAHPKVNFFFAAFQNIVETTGATEIVRCTLADRLFLRLSPLHLFKRVYVGNPSCTLIRNTQPEVAAAGSGTITWYDPAFKFVVDFEFYIRLIRGGARYHYIDSVMTNVGFHDEQVTRYTFLVAAVQIPENMGLLQKLGPRILRNVFVYDYYWRMFRNLGIRSVKDLDQWYPGAVHPLLGQMIVAQSRVSQRLLKRGYFSKLWMTANYLLSLFRRA